MTHLSGKELAQIELRARAMRAEAVRDAFRAMRTWVTARLGGARAPQSGTQHG